MEEVKSAMPSDGLIGEGRMKGTIKNGTQRSSWADWMDGDTSDREFRGEIGVKRKIISLALEAVSWRCLVTLMGGGQHR